MYSWIFQWVAVKAATHFAFLQLIGCMMNSVDSRHLPIKQREII